MKNKVKTKPGKECFCCKRVKEGTTIEGRHVCDSCNHIKEKA